MHEVCNVFNCGNDVIVELQLSEVSEAAKVIDFHNVFETEAEGLDFLKAGSLALVLQVLRVALDLRNKL